MNDAGREALVAAALRGHKQVIGLTHAYTEVADCALGVLHLAVHGNDRAYVLENCENGNVTRELAEAFEVTEDEFEEIINRNDILGQDFLTIARKVGYDED